MRRLQFRTTTNVCSVLLRADDKSPSNYNAYFWKHVIIKIPVQPVTAETSSNTRSVWYDTPNIYYNRLLSVILCYSGYTSIIHHLTCQIMLPVLKTLFSRHGSSLVYIVGLIKEKRVTIIRVLLHLHPQGLSLYCTIYFNIVCDSQHCTLRGKSRVSS